MMNRTELLRRVAELSLKRTLHGLDDPETVEASSLLGPVAKLLDRSNPAQARAFTTAEAARKLKNPERHLEPLWDAHTLLTDTDEDVWVILSMWALEAKPAVKGVKFSSQRRALLRKLRVQADDLIPRVVNRFNADLPQLVRAYKLRVSTLKASPVRMCLSAHTTLAPRFAGT